MINKFLQYIVLVFLISFLFSVIPVTNIKAQQDPLYTQYMFNKLVYNPAFAGTNPENICATFLLRSQWTGFGGEKYIGDAPQTQTFSIHTPLYSQKTRKNNPIARGLGLFVYSDQLGYESSTAFNLSFSAGRDFRFGTFHAGLYAGFIERGVNGDEWRAKHPDDPNLPKTDKDQVLDLGLGFYLFSPRYFAGFSIKHFTEPTYDWEKNSGDVLTQAIKRHFYISGGYNFMLGFMDNFTFQPSFIIKSDMVKNQLDLNANILYKNKFWGGLQYRNQDAISLLLGMKLTPVLKFGYSYDFTTSQLRKFSNGTHEVMISYCFNIKIKTVEKFPNIIYSPRYLNGY
jgi:type IX secretion system PorP/SprF family membrane protein